MVDRDSSLVRKEARALVQETRARTALVVKSTALLWVIQVVNAVVFGGGLNHFGVVPRSITGLTGILFAPFLHASFGPLTATTVPFLLLGWLVPARKRLDFWVVGAASALTAGLGAWAFGGAGTVHIGASGVIFGFLGFLMGRGLFERRAGTMVLSLAVTFFFGGMLWGLLPMLNPGVSWQSHLFGWLGGLAVARTLGRELARS